MAEWETDTYTFDLSSGGCGLHLSLAPSQDDFPFTLHISRDVVLRGHARVVACVRSDERHSHYVCLRFERLRREQRSVLEVVIADAHPA